MTMSASEIGRRATRWLACVGALLAVVFGSTRVAWAEASGPNALPVSVVAVKSDDALDQAEALTQALKKAVQHSTGWSLADGNQSLEYLALELKCTDPIDAVCEARIADVIKADRYLWSVIKLSDDKNTVLGSLHFFERGKGTKVASLNYSANLTDATDDSLVKVAKDAMNVATGGPPKGGLRVVTGGIAGQIYVDGEPKGALPAAGIEFQLPVGRHRVTVKAPAHADGNGSATIRPSTTVEVKIKLTPVAPEKPVDGRIVGGAIAAGAGLAGAAVGLWASLSVNSIREDPKFTEFAAGLPSNYDVCEVAAAGNVPGDVAGGQDRPGRGSAEEVSSMCDDASTMEIIQAVAYPVGGVAFGVGLFLIGTSSLVSGDDAGDDKAAAWTVVPVVGPSFQGVSVGGRF